MRNDNEKETMMKTTTYKNVRIEGANGMYWIAGCPAAGQFPTMAAVRRYIDENTWACPGNAGG
jgi:hypothetical protein